MKYPISFEKTTAFICVTTLFVTLSQPLYATEAAGEETGTSSDNTIEHTTPETSQTGPSASETDENSITANSDSSETEPSETESDTNTETQESSDTESRSAEPATEGIAIDPANFPDPVFRTYVSAHFDTDKDNILTNQEREAVTNIQINDQALGSLEGIRYFPNLETLNCYSQALSSINVSENIHLKTLISHYNYSLTSLILGSKPELTYLDCYGTNLSSLDISQAPALETMICTSTPLQSLDVSHNTRLRTLQCSNTYIATLDIANLSELVELQAFRMPLTQLDIRNNPKLQLLWVNWTKLTSLDTSNNPELTDLLVYDTPIQTLDLTNNPKLSSLVAAYTPGENNFCYINLPSGQTGYAELPAQNTLYLDTNSTTIDLEARFPGMKTDHISDLKGAVLNGSRLSGYHNGTPVTYTYDCGQGRTIEVAIHINTTQIKPNLSIVRNLSKIYDGNPVSLEKKDLDMDGADGPLTIEWYKEQQDDLVLLEQPPADAGRYVVKVTMAATETSTQAQTSQRFTIAQQPNYWIEDPHMPSHTYDGQAPEPQARPNTGTVQFSYSTSQDGPWQDEPFINAGQYFLRAQVQGTNNISSLETIVPYQIDRKAVGNVPTPEAYGTSGQSLSQIALPAGWTWTNPNQYLHADNEQFTAYLPVDTVNYDYSNVEGFSPYEKAVVRLIHIHRSNLPNRWVRYPSIESWTYGQTPSRPDALATLGSYAIQYTYFERNDLTTPIEKPADAGLYTLVAQISGTSNYSGLSGQTDFEIRKAANTWTEQPAIQSWTYGQAPSRPAGTAENGTVHFSYAVTQDGPFTDEIPVNAGTYVMKAEVPGSKNYEALYAYVPFTIKKQIVNNVETPEAYGTSTMQLKDIPLPQGWAWTDPEQYVYDANRHHEAYFIADTANYDYSAVPGYDPDTGTITRTIAVQLCAASNEWTQPLTIEDWAYGQKPSAPKAQAKYGSETIRYEYYTDTSLSTPIEKPTEAGTYVVQAVIPGTADYTGLKAHASFTIRKADNSWLLGLMQNDYVYNGQPPKPYAIPKDGTVRFTYAADPAGPFTDNAPVNAGTYYVKAYVPESNNYNALETVQSFQILRQIVDNVPSPDVYAASQTRLQDIALENGWKWAQPDTILTSETRKQVITKTVDPQNYDYSNVEGYDPQTNTITRMITIEMSRLDNEWIHPLEIKNWTFGQSPSVPAAIPKYGNVGYVYTDLDGTPLKAKPDQAGTYILYAYVTGTADYAGLHASQRFTIEKADNTWTIPPAIDNMVYNGQSPQPQAQAAVGTVQFQYRKKGEDSWTSEVPVNAGIYEMKASVSAMDNYNPLESGPIQFEIKKMPAETIPTPVVYALSGSVLKNVPLPAGWTWANENEIVHSQNDTHEILMPADDPNIDYSNVEGYDPSTRTIARKVTIHLSANPNEWTKPLRIEDWTYGQEPNEPQAQAKYGTDRIQYEYFDENGTYLGHVPDQAGTYYVYAYVTGTADYAGLTGQSVSFTIRKADNTWTEEPAVSDTVYTDPVEPTGKAEHGTIRFEYKEKGSDRWTDEKPVDAGEYEFRATVSNVKNYNDLSAQGSFTIRPLPAQAVQTPEVYGRPGQRLADIPLPQGWTWANGNEIVHSQNDTHEILMPADDPNYDYSNVEGYDPETKTIVRKITVHLSQLDNAWIEPLSIEDWTYGQKGNEPQARAKYGTIEYTYFDAEGNRLPSVPGHAGTYTVTAYVPGTADYTGLSAKTTFTIRKADNAWTEGPAVESVTYGELLDPVAAAKYGMVQLTYSTSRTGEFTADVPENAGSYYMKAMVPASADINGLESIVSFTIMPKAAEEIETPHAQAHVGDTLSKAALPSGWTWLDPAEVVSAQTENALAFYPAADPNYDYSKIEGYDPETKTIVRPVRLTVLARENEWIESPMIKDWTYGEAPNEPAAQAKYGTVEFAYYTVEGKRLDRVPVNAGTYVLYASVAGTAEYSGLGEVQSFAIRPKIVESIETPSAYGKAGQTLSQIALPAGWSWQDPAIVLKAGNETQTVIMQADDPNYDYSNVEGYDPETKTIVRKITVHLSQLDNAWIEPLSIEDWTYGQKGNEPQARAKYGTIEYTYFDAEGNRLPSVPGHAGTYTVTAYVPGTADYTGLSAKTTFTIRKADNAWTEGPAVESVTYGEPLDPVAAAKYGMVQLTYSTSRTGEFTTDVPENAGSYYMKATVPASADVNGLESGPVRFVIEPLYVTKHNGVFRNGEVLVNGTLLQAGRDYTKLVERVGRQQIVRYVFHGNYAGVVEFSETAMPAQKPENELVSRPGTVPTGVHAGASVFVQTALASLIGMISLFAGRKKKDR